MCVRACVRLHDQNCTVFWRNTYYMEILHAFDSRARWHVTAITVRRSFFPHWPSGCATSGQVGAMLVSIFTCHIPSLYALSLRAARNIKYHPLRASSACRFWWNIRRGQRREKNKRARAHSTFDVYGIPDDGRLYIGSEFNLTCSKSIIIIIYYASSRFFNFSSIRVCACVSLVFFFFLLYSIFW